MGIGRGKTRRREKTAFARGLRSRATAAEELAWKLLRNRGIHGVKFRRQALIRGFIVDFYCADLKLVLELDGSIHEVPAQHAYDLERDAALRREGLTIVRIPNAEVTRARLEVIVAQALTPAPLPNAGEGAGG